jgi:molybdopterin-containing oxidoreductase family membrane subunit
MTSATAIQMRKLKGGAWGVAEVILLILALIGLAAWIYQLANGLAATNMTDLVPWGLYITAFMYLVGLSAGGLIVASAGEIFNVAKLKPLAPLAIWLSFICIGLAGLSIIPDLGSPQRIYQLVTNPQWASPLVWDVVIITFYLVLSAVYLWVHAKAEGEGAQAARWQVWVHRLAYIALPAAILVHSITAWIFGLQISRAYWHSALLAPLFISSALVSGLGLFILAILLARRAKIVQVGDQVISWLGGLLAVFILVDLFFLVAELLTRLYPGAAAEASSAQILLTGRYAPLFWSEVIGGLAIPFVLLVVKDWRAKVSVVGIAAILAIVGIFLKRFNILMAGYAYPFDSVPNGIQVQQVLPWTRMDNLAQFVQVPSVGGMQLSLAYAPALLELAIVVGLLAAGALVWLIGLQLIPLHVKENSKS